MQRRTFLQRTVIMAVTGAAAAAGPGFGLAPADETTGTDADELPTLARFQLRGTITAIHANPTSTDLGGHRIVADASVNPDLKIEGTLEVGAIAHVAGYLQRSGDALQLMASRIEVRPAESQRFRLSGVVSELNAEAKFIVIDGQKIMLDASKVPSLTVDPSVKVGVRALAQGLVLEGVKYAILVRAVAAEREGFHVKGVVSELDPEGKFIVIDGQRIVLDASIVPTLRIDPAVKAGGLAEAFGLVLDGFKYAVVVWAGERERFEVEGLVRELDRAAKFVVIDGEKILLGESKLPFLRIDPNLAVGVEAKAHGLVLDGAKYAAVVTVEDEDRGEGRGRRDRFHLRGEIERVADGLIVLKGRTIDVSHAEVRGDLAVGRHAQVRGIVRDSALIAHDVRVLPEASSPPGQDEDCRGRGPDWRSPGARGAGSGRG